MSLASGGASYIVGADVYFAKLYIDNRNTVGAYVTFRNPMIHFGTKRGEYIPYRKCVYPIPACVRTLEGWGLGVNETYHNRLVWNVAKGLKQYRREVGIRAYKSGDEGRSDCVTDGTETVYILDAPEITDLSEVLSDDNFIEVEGGGTITAVNTYALAAPMKIEYQLKEETA